MGEKGAVELTEIGATTYAADAPTALFVFAHGAGAGQRHPFMVGVARALAERGVDVVTFDFPYMRQDRRRGAPDRPPVLEQAFREAIDGARAWSRARRLFIGGKSMGGRIATHLAAQGADDLSGVICLGYPLHPPGKPQQLRVAHLPSVAAPVLIVQGERDAFGTPSELQPHLATMKAPVAVHVVERGDHSLSVRGRPPTGSYAEISDVAARWIHSFV
jgi:predicted alpha/beta-hydrolase family hydrolase